MNEGDSVNIAMLFRVSGIHSLQQASVRRVNLGKATRSEGSPMLGPEELNLKRNC